MVRFHQGALHSLLSEQGHLLLPRAHRQAVADLEPGPDALDSRKQRDRFGLVISLGQAGIDQQLSFIYSRSSVLEPSFLRWQC